jgi:DNA-binding transcriptional MerR regulator
MNDILIKYKLRQLSEISQVPDRRIHHYIQKGLLPPPNGKGRGAYYSQTHLDRLAQIQTMRSENLSPQKIRAKLIKYNPDVLHQKLSNGKPEILHRYQIYPGIELCVGKKLDAWLQGNQINIQHQFAQLLKLLLEKNQEYLKQDMSDPNFMDIDFEWWKQRDQGAKKDFCLNDDFPLLKNNLVEKINERKGELT